MTPLIERMERHIIAAGPLLVPGISAEELEAFATEASNPADVQTYFERWNVRHADVEVGLDENDAKADGHDGEVEVVVSSDEDGEDGEDEDDGFFV